MENQITGLQAGQPESVSENPTLTSQDSQNDASPKFATIEDLASLKAEILREANSSAQSLVDKKGNAINAKIAMLQKAGITATPEQARALVEADEQAQSGTQGPQPANAAQSNEPAIDPQISEWFQKHTGNADNAKDPYYMAVYEISKRAGDMFIEESDPEFESINREFASGSDYVASFAQAIAQKKSRLATDNNKQFAAIPAMFSGGQKSNSVPDNIDYRMLYSKAFSGQ